MIWVIALVAAVFTALCVWIAYENKNLEINEFEICSKFVPEGFNNFRIALLSDIHNSVFGKENITLIDMVQKSEPDIIVISGDLVDSRRTKIDVCTALCEALLKIAPVYFVCGNHESRIKDYKRFINELKAMGVNVLENEIREIEANGDCISLIGLKDPSFDGEPVSETGKRRFVNNLYCLRSACKGYKVVLSHRPEYFEHYAGSGVDLVLCGHAHGGQFILPFVGAIKAPAQGFFPDYYRGVYEKDCTQMVVSRGIGNSAFPFRLNNNPEIVVATLMSQGK